jgi:methionyl-tRNA synthetase
MVHKYFKGVLPEPGPSFKMDKELKARAIELIDKYEELMMELGFHKALMAIWEVIGNVNKYIDTMAPWILAKSDKERLATVMYHIIETLKIISALIWPVMPETAEKIQDQLGLGKKGRDLKLMNLRVWGQERPVRSLTTAHALFPRIDAKKQENPPTPPISFDEFQKMDLRIGTIIEAEAIAGSKKLIKLTVDIGEKRTVVAGLKGHYAEGDLIGKQVLLVANLQAVKLMGVKSHGMVLAAEDKSGLHLLVPDTDTLPGSEVK